MVRKPPRPRSAAVRPQGQDDVRADHAGAARPATGTRRCVEHVRRQLARRARRRAGAAARPARPATTKTAAVHPQQRGEARTAQATPAPRAPATPAVTRPNTDSRALADVSDSAGGQHAGDDGGAQHVVRLGQHQDAEGRRVEQQVVVVRRHDQRQRRAGRTRLAASAHRRPRCSRSSSGPMTGASTANGAMVTSR